MKLGTIILQLILITFSASANVTTLYDWITYD